MHHALQNSGAPTGDPIKRMPPPATLLTRSTHEGMQWEGNHFAILAKLELLYSFTFVMFTLSAYGSGEITPESLGGACCSRIYFAPYKNRQRLDLTLGRL